MPITKRMTDEQVVEMRSMWAAGQKLKAIADHFQWSSAQVWRVVVGKSYRKAGGVITGPRRATP